MKKIIIFLLLILFFSCTPPEKNPWKYDVSAFTNINSELLTYQEEQNHTMPAGAELICADELIYITAGNILYTFTPDMKKKSEIYFTEKITAISYAAPDLYLAFSSYILTSNTVLGTTRHFSTGSKYSDIISIAASAGEYYLADYGESQIWRFSENEKLLSVIGKNDGLKFILPSRYFACTSDQRGNFYFVNPGRRIIFHYKNGEKISSWGTSGFNIEAFTGCCNPSRMIFHGNELYTVEKGLLRIKKYSSDGKLLALVAGQNDFLPETVPDLAVDKKSRVIVLDHKKKQVRFFSERKTGSPDKDKKP
ncbi:MAG: hypothetical protein A2096_08150 [Spirochaetes bacterium GWF1_41_5]|nr:MAG: hypothetical protein A2096_08150 [Spirochaetes bacterium GWF1_41_5]HBE01864.1 hypothetical protein [Spirochaetia bacterium]